MDPFELTVTWALLFSVFEHILDIGIGHLCAASMSYCVCYYIILPTFLILVPLSPVVI